jgi:hypothetical protein
MNPASIDIPEGIRIHIFSPAHFYYDIVHLYHSRKGVESKILSAMKRPAMRQRQKSRAKYAKFAKLITKISNLLTMYPYMNMET